MFSLVSILVVFSFVLSPEASEIDGTPASESASSMAVEYKCCVPSTPTIASTERIVPVIANEDPRRFACCFLVVRIAAIPSPRETRARTKIRLLTIGIQQVSRVIIPMTKLEIANALRGSGDCCDFSLTDSRGGGSHNMLPLSEKRVELLSRAPVSGLILLRKKFIAQLLKMSKGSACIQ